MKKLAAAIFFFSIIWAGITVAQVPQFPQNLPPNTVVGRSGIGPGPAQALSFQSLLQGLIGAGFSPVSFAGPCDGSTDVSAALNSLITAANAAGGGKITLPAGTCAVGSTIVMQSNVYLVGNGVSATTIKLKNGVNADVVDGQNANSLFGTGSNSGVSYFGISDLTIDGNSANNTGGTCLAIYGFRFDLTKLRLQNCSLSGLRTEYGGTSLPLESNFLNILIENTQNHGWLFEGPHDSNADFVYVVDCCQAANNTWDGFNLTAPAGNASANLHARHLHAYHTSGSITNRMRFAWNDAGGGGNDISDSNFEGANVPGLINSSNNTLINNAFYAAWGGTSTLIVKQSLNTIIGFIGQPGAGRGAVSGIVLGQGADNAASNIIDVTVGTQNLGSIDFTHSAGSNTIRLRGFQTTGPGFIGFPGQLDSVDLNITGTPTSLPHLYQTPGKISTGIGAAGPTVSGCGTSPTITGSDTAGIIGSGSGATGCTLTFNSPWTNVPFCLVTAQSGTAPGYSRTATQLILSVATASNFYHYLCIGPPGG
jgi:Pectate lyase superfamily protein